MIVMVLKYVYYLLFSDELIAELQTPEFVNYIKEHTSPKYGADLELRKKEPQVPVASFRKLNVDWHTIFVKLSVVKCMYLLNC